MFTSMDKALVALVMAIIYILNHFFGIHLGLDEATVTTFITLITPIIVWLTPNKTPQS